MRILIAEDDDPKYQRLREFVQKEFDGIEVAVMRSVTTVLSSLRNNHQDLMLLDMSLPTYEVAPGERGGRPQDFGGLTIMDFMDYEGLTVPVIIVTQYETFPIGNGESMSIEAMAAKAAIEHPNAFKGLVYYNSVENVWQEPLKNLMLEVLLDGTKL